MLRVIWENKVKDEGEKKSSYNFNNNPLNHEIHKWTVYARGYYSNIFKIFISKFGSSYSYL